MDISRFDGFARSISAHVTRRTGLGLLAGASLPFLGLAEATDAKKKKITLCVNGKTVKAPKKKAKKLLKQGATKGACAEGCPGGQKACGSGCIPVGDCCDADDCTGTDLCENGTCVPLTCGNGGACTVFQTAADTFTGAIGGLAGGDAACQAAANAANLDGTFKAWLSIDQDTPETRFTNVDNAGPYRLVAIDSDGGNPPPKVADTFADLFTCGGGACLDNAISRDENGDTPPTPQLVWTGTKANGEGEANDTCSGWTSAADGIFGLSGQNSATSGLWTEFSDTTPCASEGRLYCFQQAV